MFSIIEKLVLKYSIYFKFILFTALMFISQSDPLYIFLIGIKIFGLITSSQKLEECFDRGFLVPQHFAEGCRKAAVPSSPSVPATRQYDMLNIMRASSQSAYRRFSTVHEETMSKACVTNAKSAQHNLFYRAQAESSTLVTI